MYIHTYFPLFSCDFLCFFQDFFPVFYCSYSQCYSRNLNTLNILGYQISERSNTGQGSNPHNIFPSFFSGNKIWWRGKIIWNFLKAIWHFPYPPIEIVLGWFLVDSMAFFTTRNRNQKRGTEICWWDNSSAMPWIQHDPTLEGLGSDFLPVYWNFFRSHPGQNWWDFLVPKPREAAFQVLFLAPRLVHVSWNLLLWLVLRRGSSLSCNATTPRTGIKNNQWSPFIFGHF